MDAMDLVRGQELVSLGLRGGLIPANGFLFSCESAIGEGVQNEALLPINDIAVRLPVFEGPLDLLLFLIRKHELDIYDIPIETVTRQYLQTLYEMEELNLEIAGEFFVMAATLMYIKSRMLLPKQDRPEDESGEEDEVDPRWELVEQLIEYKKFKEVSLDLEALIRRSQDAWQRQVESLANAGERPLKPSDRIELWNVFNAVLRRLAERVAVGEIHEESVTVADRMERILERIRTRAKFRFSELFDQSDTIHTLGVTFLALLELTRLGEIGLSQSADFSDIEIERISKRRSE